jgi:hypothetical protein
VPGAYLPEGAQLVAVTKADSAHIETYPA